MKSSNKATWGNRNHAAAIRISLANSIQRPWSTRTALARHSFAMTRCGEGRGEGPCCSAAPPRLGVFAARPGHGSRHRPAPPTCPTSRPRRRAGQPQGGAGAPHRFKGAGAGRGARSQRRDCGCSAGEERADRWGRATPNHLSASRRLEAWRPRALHHPRLEQLAPSSGLWLSSFQPWTGRILGLTWGSLSPRQRWGA